jgi:WXG100 family type VII secretion target
MTSNEGLFVSHSSLDEIIAQLRGHMSAMQDRLERLGRDLAGLREGFAGSAKDAYIVAQAQWDRQFVELGSVLSAAAIAVSRAGAAYGEADRYGASLFRGAL